MSQAELQRLVDERYIRASRHPEAPLTIYNYTAKAAYEKVWTPETLACRGLILHDDGTVAAQPFPKFFNYQEHQGPLPDEPFEVFEKVDGSLGIVYWLDGKPYVATRGSFASDQALWATRWLHAHMGEWSMPFEPPYTYLFEIVYPSNRIVVDYGDYAGLVLLAIIDPCTGAETRWWNHPDETATWGVKLARHWPDMAGAAVADLALREVANEEGFVIRYESGLRLKVKFSDYLRLHRLLTGLNERHIWECLSTGTDLATMLQQVPDEFYVWAQTIADRLQDRYDEIELGCRAWFDNRPEGSHKDVALYFQRHESPTVLFALLDGKPHAPAIWKMLRPDGSATFRCGDDL